MIQQDFRSTAGLQEWDKFRQDQVAKWKCKTSGVITCPLGEGFWERSFCLSRIEKLRGAAGTTTQEQQIVSAKLAKCQKCWNSYSM